MQPGNNQPQPTPPNQSVQGQGFDNTPNNGFGHGPQPAAPQMGQAGIATDPSIPQNAPMPTPSAPTGADADQPQNANQPGGVQLIDAGRAEAFTKNFAYLCQEAVDLTGLPIDVLLGQIVKNAGQQGLPGQGIMLDFGAGSAFAPTQQVMEGWTRSYFQRIMEQQRMLAGHPNNGMAEA